LLLNEAVKHKSFKSVDSQFQARGVPTEKAALGKRIAAYYSLIDPVRMKG